MTTTTSTRVIARWEGTDRGPEGFMVRGRVKAAMCPRSHLPQSVSHSSPLKDCPSPLEGRLSPPLRHHPQPETHPPLSRGRPAPGHGRRPPPPNRKLPPPCRGVARPRPKAAFTLVHRH